MQKEVSSTNPPRATLEQKVPDHYDVKEMQIFFSSLCAIILKILTLHLFSLFCFHSLKKTSKLTS